ncbi:tetratricopeptide repeat protein [Archangium primigenium]|uniref:tetratricopeptide repeat protein n=1 Tax=[Archangium] primigenium TaxID=2792470 RepID=UPI001956C2BE|nr:tetratricopeptide repeat protein [Archangium primigenium]
MSFGNPSRRAAMGSSPRARSRRALGLSLLVVVLLAASAGHAGGPSRNKGGGGPSGTSSVHERSAREFVFCGEETVPRKAFQRKGATHFVVADFRPRSERAEDIELGRAAANTVDRLLRDYMVRVAMEEDEKQAQTQTSKELEVYRLRCVIQDATAALAIGKAMGADLLLWGDAVCPLGQGQGARLVNIITTIEAKDNSRIHTGEVSAGVELPKVETGSFCARASMTTPDWPMMDSGGDEARSAWVLELGNVELPQVVAGDALGLTLFVGGLHFYKRDDYPRALRLFRRASETLRTDSRSAATLLRVMGLTEFKAGRSDRAANFFQRCETVAEADAPVWWSCRSLRVTAHALAAHLTEAKALAEDALQRARRTGHRNGEALSLMSLSVLALHLSDFKEARARYTEALSVDQTTGLTTMRLPLSALEDEGLDTSELKEARGRREMELALYGFLGRRMEMAVTRLELGDLSLRLLEPEEARSQYEQALGLRDAIGVPVFAAAVLNRLGSVALLTSDVKEARARYLEALSLFREHGSPLGEAESLATLGGVALLISDMKEARARCAEALALYRSIGSRQGEPYALSCLGSVALLTSDMKEARSRFAEALALYRTLGQVMGEANTLKSQGDLASRLAEFDAAREKYTQALALYRTAQLPLGEASVLRSQGDLALRMSEENEARDTYEQALALYQSHRFRLGEAHTLKSQGDLALHLSKPQEAQEKYEGALKLFQAIEPGALEAGARFGLGRVAEALGREDEASAAHAQARAGFERTGCRQCLVTMDWRRGLVLSKRGETQRAREVLVGARQAAMDLGEVALTRDIQASLDALGGAARP